MLGSTTTPDGASRAPRATTYGHDLAPWRGQARGDAPAPPQGRARPPAPPEAPPPPSPAPAPRPPFRLGHRPALDGLRGIAVTVVVAAHLGQFVWPDASGWLLYPGGFVGVDLFFVLSGFLITTLLVAELDRRGRVRLATFAWRRALRLTPALAVAVAAMLAATLLGWLPHDPELQAKRSVWALLYLQAYEPVDHMPHPELAQTWSLAVEMHFYLLWSAACALVVAVAPRRARAVLAAVALAVVAAVVVTRAQRSAAGQHALLLYANTPNRLDAPLVGSLAGLAFASGRLDGVTGRRHGRGAAVLAGLGLAGLLAVAVAGDPLSPWLYRGGFTGIAVVAAAAVVGAAALRPGPLARVLTWRPLVGLGLVSYSLFLWHMPVFTILHREATDWPGAGRVAVAVAATALLTAASYVFVERPAQRLRREPYRPRHMRPPDHPRRSYR